MITERLKSYLDEQRVNYHIIGHPRTHTAQRTAASAHISGREIAKTVMARVDNELMMLVLPANYKVSLTMLRDALPANSVAIASETEFSKYFPDCEEGAMPPFGNLYALKVLVDEHLTADEEIAFNAGTHTDLVKMAYKDYEKLMHPTVRRFSVRLN